MVAGYGAAGKVTGGTQQENSACAGGCVAADGAAGNGQLGCQGIDGATVAACGVFGDLAAFHTEGGVSRDVQSAAAAGGLVFLDLAALHQEGCAGPGHNSAAAGRSILGDLAAVHGHHHIRVCHDEAAGIGFCLVAGDQSALVDGDSGGVMGLGAVCILGAGAIEVTGTAFLSGVTADGDLVDLQLSAAGDDGAATVYGDVVGDLTTAERHTAAEGINGTTGGFGTVFGDLAAVHYQVGVGGHIDRTAAGLGGLVAGDEALVHGKHGPGLDHHSAACQGFIAGNFAAVHGGNGFRRSHEDRAAVAAGNILFDLAAPDV